MRCSWAENADATMQAYHDTEWGVPHHDDRALFELITLEGAQAGLSWRTVLARREAYRAAFHGFDIGRVAAMTDADLTSVLTDSGVIRHRQKIWSVRDNARAALAVIEAHGSLDAWLWGFVDGQPIVNRWRKSDAGAGDDRDLRPHEQDAAQAGFPLCRLHDMLRVHAGDRHGRRSSGDLHVKTR